MRRNFLLGLVLTSVVASSWVGVANAQGPNVVYVSTPHDVVAKMLEMAGVTEDDVVYDLGCGDGRIVITAAKRHGCTAVGYEIEPEHVERARRNAEQAGVEELVSIQQKDIFTLDLRPADVITVYLLPKLNVRLIPQFEKLEPGSRIVSHEFDMEGVKPDRVVSLQSKEDNVVHTIYLWTTPLRMEESAREQAGLELAPAGGR